MKRGESRIQILTAAAQLFDKFGIKAISADRIIQEAQISKPTFYAHFPNKADLICAYLDGHDAKWMEYLNLLQHSKGVPARTLLKIFDVLAKWFEASELSGCAFIRALGDADVQSSSEAKASVQNHFVQTEAQIKVLTNKVNPKLSQQLTSEIMLLMAGSLLSAQLSGNLTAINNGKKILASRLKDLKLI